MNKILLLFFILFLLSSFSTNATAQQFEKLNSFNTSKGLPSNHIYDITEDNKGFLWIATDNGISRFDGKNFQNFSIKDGLPSNDVIQVVKEVDGTIWVNSYKEPPAYFDEKNNKFIKFTSNDTINKITQNFYLLSLTLGGDICMRCNNVNIILKNKRIKSYIDNILESNLFFSQNGKKNSRYAIKNNDGLPTVILLENNTKKDSVILKVGKGNLFKVGYNIMSWQNKNTYYIASFKDAGPTLVNVDSLQIDEQIISHELTFDGKSILTTTSGAYITKENSCVIDAHVFTNTVTNVCYTDKNKNIWIGTLDDGLLLYSSNVINISQEIENLKHNSFLSVAAKSNGEIFAGNYYGELVHQKNNKITIQKASENNSSIWLRKTIVIGNKIVTINDNFCTIDFKKRVVLKNQNWLTVLKSGAALNDSILILSSIIGLVKLNINNEQYQYVNDKMGRVDFITKDLNNTVYYVGNSGLYKHNFSNNITSKIEINELGKSIKLSAIKFAIDSTLWISTTSGNLIVLKNDKIIATIKNNIGLPESITCIGATKNKIWLGSKTGITVINYSYLHNKLQYAINNISKTDGLPSNIINDFAFFKDSVVVATENGFATFSINFVPTIAIIKPQLIGVKVNTKDVSINENLFLEYGQNNVILTFAGVDLTGHFSRLQYCLNNEPIWNDLIGNSLNLKLQSGTYKIQVRAIDINNNISKENLLINIAVSTPFYARTWFLVLLAMAITALIVWYNSIRNLKAQKQVYDKQIAIANERSRITADLHDDIGSTISSINVYSNVATQVIDTNTPKAKELLAKLNQQSKNLMENLSEIIWSMKTDDKQLMTLETRIKNHVTDVLSSSEINYTLNIDPTIDTHFTEINARKNIMLIVKEAINNISKYSQATQVNVSFTSINKKQFMLEIKDNGIGFNASIASNGNGLSNIKKRTQELDGICTIEAEVNKGVKVCCVF